MFIGGGGILYSDLDSLTIFIFGGGILYSELDSLTIFIGWGGRGSGGGRGYSTE